MYIMGKEKFLTIRWNNTLSLGLGIPGLIYVIIVLYTSILSASAGFIGLVVIGVLYWVVVEQHTNMRFVLLREKSADPVPPKLEFTHPFNLIMIAYNVIWWIPIVLTFTKTIDYNAGFIAFFVVTLIRLIANLLRNNILKGEQAESFPLRSP